MVNNGKNQPKAVAFSWRKYSSQNIANQWFTPISGSSGRYLYSRINFLSPNEKLLPRNLRIGWNHNLHDGLNQAFERGIWEHSKRKSKNLKIAGEIGKIREEKKEK